jgi:hypothetical protein
MADTQQVVREFLDLSVEEKREAKQALARAGELPAPEELPPPSRGGLRQEWGTLYG